MDAILEKFADSKYNECINLLENQLVDSETLVDTFVYQNCLNVCRCLVILHEGDAGQIVPMQESLCANYKNMIGHGLPDAVIPVELELTTLFNAVWWCFHYKPQCISLKFLPTTCVPLVRKGLRRVLGISCKLNRCENDLKGILYDIRSIGKKIPLKNYYVASLTLELAVMMLIYVLQKDNTPQMVVQTFETVSALLDDIELLMSGLKTVKDVENPNYLHRKLFKFGYLKMNDIVTNSGTWCIDGLYLIQSICLFKMKKYEEILTILSKNAKSSLKTLWYYLGAFSSLMVDDPGQSLGYIISSTATCTNVMLKSRFQILHGQIMSGRGKHNEAITHFEAAKAIFPYIPAVHYYMGEEFGRIGSNECMIQCFEDLLKNVKEQPSKNHHEFECNFEKLAMDLLHPADEITEVEVLYALAVSYGLTMKYEKSIEYFDKCIELFPARACTDGEDRIVRTPNLVTVLHEIATMNILSGNLIRAVQYLMEASNKYVRSTAGSDVHNAKPQFDQESRTSNDAAIEEEINCAALYDEGLLQVFEEDIVALMLSAEIQKMHGSDTYRPVLGKIISAFSSYLARTKGRKNQEESERNRSTLVKALAAKSFLHAAKYQLSQKPGVDIERTFKRALSYNRGDKDVIHQYFEYLKSRGRPDDANELWNMFRDNEESVKVDRCQSLALRYLLRTVVSREELDKIDEDEFHRDAI